MDGAMINPIFYFKNLLKHFEDKPDETYWGKTHNAISRDMVTLAIIALEKQYPSGECDQCQYYKNDFYYCPHCGRKLAEKHEPSTL